MARYYLLLNWTDKGLHEVKDTITRAAAARQVFEKAGARLSDLHWTLGPYDLVLTADAPDEETITAASLALAKLGNIRTLTMRAFNESEMQKVLKKL